MTKVDIFMAAGWIGLAGVSASIIIALFDAPSGLKIAAGLVAVMASWVMLFTRNADEYTLGLWTSAASLAFATLLVLFIALPFLDGFYTGLSAAPEGEEARRSPRTIPSIVSISAAITAFYVGLFWKRLRGGVTGP